MQGLVASNAFQSWLDEKVLDATLEFDGLSRDDAQWVIDQIS